MGTTYRNNIYIYRIFLSESEEGYGSWSIGFGPVVFKKNALSFDFWLKDITPSTHLRQWFHEHSDGAGANLLIVTLRNSTINVT